MKAKLIELSFFYDKKADIWYLEWIMQNIHKMSHLSHWIMILPKTEIFLTTDKIINETSADLIEWTRLKIHAFDFDQ